MQRLCRSLFKLSGRFDRLEEGEGYQQEFDGRLGDQSYPAYPGFMVTNIPVGQVSMALLFCGSLRRLTSLWVELDFFVHQ